MTDLFITLGKVAGAALPQDRAIDRVDQSAFLFGDQAKSARQGFLFYIKSELRAVRCRDWKLHFYWEPEVNEGKAKLQSPCLFNITRDPKEEGEVQSTTPGCWVPYAHTAHGACLRPALSVLAQYAPGKAD